jgi:hypothetical protein
MYCKIKDFERYWVFDDGKVRNSETGRFLKEDTNNCGYKRVTLSKEGKTSRFFVHRLVCEAFFPKPEKVTGRLEVNHINGIKSDNRSVNVEWSSGSQNKQHALSLGLRNVGENHVNATVTNLQVIHACTLISGGFKQSDTSKLTGLTVYQIKDIRRRKTWKHISKSYQW